jgi:flagellar protein FlbD
MITLTRLNGKPFTLNALYIEQVQSFPDTTITLVSGAKVVVGETEEIVKERVHTFYQSIGLIGCKLYEGVNENE